MTKYLEKKFTVPLGGKEYGEGWERIFGDREDPPVRDKTKRVRRNEEERRTERPRR